MLSCHGLQCLFAKLHPQIPISSPVLPCEPLACHVLQLGKGARVLQALGTLPQAGGA